MIVKIPRFPPTAESPIKTWIPSGLQKEQDRKFYVPITPTEELIKDVLIRFDNIRDLDGVILDHDNLLY